MLQLTLGYNGLDRVLGGGSEGPPGGAPDGPPGGTHHLFFGGEPGIGRLFGDSMGTQASWLLPAALIGLLAGLWFTRRTGRTASVRASLLLWGGWLIVTAAGILVAVEAVILFNFFSQRANRIATELKLLTDEFLELLLDQPGDSQPSRRSKRDSEADSKLGSTDTKETKRAKGDGDGDREAA
jgi:hypothetical protein